MNREAGMFMSDTRPETVALIHERGLVTCSDEETQAIVASYGFRPIVRIRSRAVGESEMTLSHTGAVLEFEWTALSSAGTSDGSVLLKTFALAYDVGAMLYHCRRLARAYAGIVAHHEAIRSIPGHPGSDSEVVDFGHRGEPYYELDALLSAARRAYDKIGRCVWQAFEGRGSEYHNLKDMLPDFQRCPGSLVARLRRSWSEVGVKLSDYRDCTQHYVSTDMGMETVTMRLIAPGLWTAWARIPDNPEARSKAKFTYHQGHDALTYGWEVSNEIVSLATEAVELAHGVQRQP